MLSYLIGTTTFAALCSLVWLILGGTMLSALGLYLISGQVAMISLIALAALKARTAKAKA